MPFRPNKEICIDNPGKDEIYRPWNQHTADVLGLDQDDIEYLEDDNTLFKADVAYTLEDTE